LGSYVTASGEFGLSVQRQNTASGRASFAGGWGALASNAYTFVWASHTGSGYTTENFGSKITNEAAFRVMQFRINWNGQEIIIKPESITMGGHTMTVVTNGGYVFIGKVE
jgi:hypothetical protein